ncbi:MAG TPA: nuclear transport factor 2 family protein [Acidimicrobiia bacterium]|nr:nuclear transport factor 2 family protein [Acidimicrobiia bacterium]
MTLDATGFRDLMSTLADAWARLDADAAIACFTDDAVYMQPPDLQFYEGRDQLRSYFGALTEGTYLDFHGIWFDEVRQVGCAEFSFGVRGRPEADHGAIVLTLRDDLIAVWREYVQPGPADFGAFVASEGKAWKWHIANYP